MFAESLLDSAWPNRSHRGWTTAASFAVQALAVGVALLAPLIYTEGLPAWQKTTVCMAPASPAGAPPDSRVRPVTAARQSNMLGEALLSPRSIPSTIQNVQESAAPPQVSIGRVPWGTSDRADNPVIQEIVRSIPIIGPPPTVTHALRPSHMMEGNLIRRVQPEYPTLARQARIQGTVVLQAVISKQGTIENLSVLSGHPMLVRAAIEAVQQWRYRPYYLNGEPVEVETQVTVNFVLSGG